MKIENSTIPVMSNEIKPSQSPSKASAPPKGEQTKASHRTAGKGRFAKWFAQAGIVSSFNTKHKLSIEEKIEARLKLQERRKMANLEVILSKAIHFCVDDESTNDIDPDWFFSFIKMAEEIYSPPMQELWGKIFAVESSKPGSFSLNTLQLLKQLTQKDALIFRRAFHFASRQKGDASPKLLIGYYRKKSIWSLIHGTKESQLNLAQFGLNYPDLLALMDLGLLHHSEIESGEMILGEPTEWRISGQNVTLSPRFKGLTLVYFKFTTTGTELSKLVNAQKQEQYFSALKLRLSHAFDIQE